MDEYHNLFQSKVEQKIVNTLDKILEPLNKELVDVRKILGNLRTIEKNRVLTEVDEKKLRDLKDEFIDFIMKAPKVDTSNKNIPLPVFKSFAAMVQEYMKRMIDLETVRIYLYLLYFIIM